jgi:hypothetical protein
MSLKGEIIMKNKGTKISSMVLLPIYGIVVLIDIFIALFFVDVLLPFFRTSLMNFEMDGDTIPMLIIIVIEITFQIICMILMLAMDHDKIWKKRSRAITFLVFNFIFSLPIWIYFIISGFMLAEYLKYFKNNQSNQNESKNLETNNATL